MSTTFLQAVASRAPPRAIQWLSVEGTPLPAVVTLTLDVGREPSSDQPRHTLTTVVHLPPPAGSDSSLACSWLERCATCLDEARRASDKGCVRVRGAAHNAAAAAAAWMVLHGSSSLLDALLQLPRQPRRSALVALLILEMRTKGGMSDLSSLSDTAAFVRWDEAVVGEGTRKERSVCLVARGQLMRLQALCSSPKMVLVDGFLSVREAAALVERARMRLACKDSGSDRGVVIKGRTSRWCMLGQADAEGEEAADVALRRAVERAAWLTGLTSAHAELCQAVHYEVGQEYSLHHDYFSNADMNVIERMGSAGNRLASVFVYLSCADEGGATCFPDLSLSLSPCAGTAVLWHNLDTKGRPDRRTLHAGTPVVAGEKFGMNIWLRQRPLDPGSVQCPAWPAPPPQTLPSPAMISVTTLKER